LQGETTYTLKDKDDQIDQSVSNYMTLKHPQPTRGSVNEINSRYPLISPFFSRIIHDLKTGVFTEQSLSRTLNDMDIIEMCQPYEPLLRFDPVSEDNHFDHRYVMVQPHNGEQAVDLSIYQYRFLLRVIRLYGRDLISPSSFITFTA
jgi:hypothetical protein